MGATSRRGYLGRIRAGATRRGRDALSGALLAEWLDTQLAKLQPARVSELVPAIEQLREKRTPLVVNVDPADQKTLAQRLG